MKALLLKDFYSVQTEYKMYGFMLPLLVALMLMLNWNSDGAASPGSFGYLVTYGVIAALGLTMNSFTYDEKYGFTQYAIATTVSRKLYLAEKYVFQLINDGIGALMGMAGMLILSAAKGYALTSEAVLGAVVMAGGCFLATFVMGIWQIGLSVRFDSAKARLIFVAMIVVIGLLGTAGSILGLLMFEEGIPLIITAGIVLVLGLTVWMFCMSFVWMQKKEF